MAQLNLFESEPAIAAPAPPNPVFVRKHLIRLLNIARAAERMPWKQSDAANWETFFPRLAQSLPNGEGEALEIAFATELKRLRAVTG